MKKAQPLTPGRNSLALFFVLSWMHMLWLTWRYVSAALDIPGADAGTLFQLSAWLFYSLLYLVPAILIALLLSSIGSATGQWRAPVAAFVTTTGILLFVWADSLIYDLYAFHFNSFVLNLVITPGGVASLGSGDQSMFSFGLKALRIVALQAAFLALSLRLPFPFSSKKYVRLVILVFSGLFLLQGIIYGISDVSNFGPVLEGSKAFPFFQRVRIRSLARKFGFEHKHRSEFFVTRDTKLRYPLEPVSFTKPSTRPNIVVLVAESLRWDQLNPITMPNTWAFSERSQRFENHYSSGNGTREALFGMFYGLYGSYWESFMTEQREPLLMERLRALGYAFDIRTSATFTYPEFDKTIFAGFPPQTLQVADQSLPAWRRDADNTDELLDFIAQTSSDVPFFEFFFFESTHASYSFPDEDALFPGYAPEMDYASLSRTSLAADIQPIYTRYRNAAHWVDVQLGRIYAQLEHKGLLDNTIVIVTGDHGEEFMEKGAWGHNSTFAEEQTHVPFVLAMPGGKKAVERHLSSHLDVATTLLETLGASGDPANFTLGVSLLDSAVRQHIAVSDWHSIGFVTPELKYRIPYLNVSGADYWTPTDFTDTPLAEASGETAITHYRDSILEMIVNCTRFTRRSDAASGAGGARHTAAGLRTAPQIDSSRDSQSFQAGIENVKTE